MAPAFTVACAAPAGAVATVVPARSAACPAQRLRPAGASRIGARWSAGSTRALVARAPRRCEFGIVAQNQSNADDQAQPAEGADHDDGGRAAVSATMSLMSELFGKPKDGAEQENKKKGGEEAEPKQSAAPSWNAINKQKSAEDLMKELLGEK
eukprot:tig00001041_g6561.t1